MSRIDLSRLRKRAGMSQRDLAEKLQVRPSFLSAIENGKSRVPDEKLEKIKEIFELDNFEDYIIEDNLEAVPPHTHPASDQNESFTQLLTQFHDLAHQRGATHGNPANADSERMDFLMRRNDRLSERVDDLRDEVDRLNQELFRLKELLVKNGIEY